jgi:glycerol-3-phosphate cytidylyltransferase
MQSEPIIGVTAGAFDLCHAGHMLMFKEAKEKCFYLIALLHDDPSSDRPQKNRPIMNIEERKIILEGIRYIDEVRTYKTEKDLYNILADMKPDIRVIGADWEGKKFTGYDLPIKVYFNSRNHGYSSSELRHRVFNAEAAAADRKEREERGVAQEKGNRSAVLV